MATAPRVSPLRRTSLWLALASGAGAYVFLAVTGRFAAVFGVLLLELAVLNISLPDVARPARLRIMVVAAATAAAGLVLGAAVRALTG